MMVDITERMLAEEKNKKYNETQKIIFSILKLSVTDISLEELLIKSFDLIVPLIGLLLKKKDAYSSLKKHQTFWL